MKRRLLFLLAMLLVFSLISSLFAASYLNKSLSKYDWGQEAGLISVNINDITNGAKLFLNSDNRNSLLSAVSRSGYSVLLISLNGNVLYDSNEEMTVGQQIDASEYLKHVGVNKRTSIVKYGDKRNEQFALAVIDIHTKQPEIEAVTSSVWVLVATLAFLFIVAGVIQYIYVYLQILRPFDKMERSACEIAKGNLDASLLMDRYKPFGAFTWAFDMLRNELKLSKEREEKTAQTKKELVASLSHDVRTPIASIRAYAEYLQSQPDKNTEKAERYINVVLQKTDEIAQLTQDLFQHALTDLDELKFSPGEYSCRELLNNILNPLMLQYESKITILSAFPDVKVFTDKQRLAQVFDNIFSNSAKYAPQSQIHVQCEVKDGMVLCCIRDFGSGVSEKDLNFLFDKFYRGQNAKDASLPGSGLGMFMAKYIMDKTDGSIRAWNWHDKNEHGFAVEAALKIVEE